MLSILSFFFFSGTVDIIKGFSILIFDQHRRTKRMLFLLLHIDKQCEQEFSWITTQKRILGRFAIHAFQITETCRMIFYLVVFFFTWITFQTRSL